MVPHLSRSIVLLVAFSLISGCGPSGGTTTGKGSAEEARKAAGQMTDMYGPPAKKKAR